jgi:hypothetical protein
LPISNPQFFNERLASWPSGKARVCKTLITGSNPVDASKEHEPERARSLLTQTA